MQDPTSPFSLEIVFMMAGSVLCGILAKGLKVLFKVPRLRSEGIMEKQDQQQQQLQLHFLKQWLDPLFNLTFPSSRNYAFPSSHSQVSFFLACYASLLLRSNGGFILLIGGFAVIISASRISLGKHTLDQTISGAIIGAVFAITWKWLFRIFFVKHS